jgi:hypothetical protein
VSTATLERTEVTAPTVARPLSPSEQDSLIALAASTEKTARVPRAGRFTGPRGWSLGGNVD